MGSDLPSVSALLERSNFNPRSPCGERRDALVLAFDDVGISIHAPRVGSDHHLRAAAWAVVRFQSTLPVWGATARGQGNRQQRRISIHAPRVGSDSPSLASSMPMARFQSTLPVWGATVGSGQLVHPNEFQSTLPVWGATNERDQVAIDADISIHAPRVGSDLTRPSSFTTRSISIHAPRVGSDIIEADRVSTPAIFQSTLPVWGATRVRGGHDLMHLFQSTLPVWGATALPGVGEVATDISIHAPRVGSDGPRCSITYRHEHFNPRSPCGERHGGQIPVARTA